MQDACVIGTVDEVNMATTPKDVPLVERVALVEACLPAALCRFRAWLAGEDDALAHVPDEALVKVRPRRDVCWTVAKMSEDLPREFAARDGWDYELRRKGSYATDDAVLWALFTSGVIEIAAESLTTLDPGEIVPYFVTFIVHVAVHNFLQGVRAPHDTCDVNRFECDGEADHLARVVALQIYNEPAGVSPLDLTDPVVQRVMTGKAVPMFRERSIRLGRAQAEHLAREARRAWRDLGARLLQDGLPATSACVLPMNGVVHVTIGTWKRSYRGATPADGAVRAHGDYAAHMFDGNLEMARAHVQVAIDTIRRPW